MAKASPARSRVDRIGLDDLCRMIADGMTMTAIAKKLGVSFGTLSNWIAADAERSARVREVRSATARLWDEMAVDRLERAKSPFQLAKAKEIAFHYRWRSSKIAPADYGDKVDVNHAGEIAHTTPEQRQARIDALLAKRQSPGASE